jgi:hypothetical protein
MKGGDMLFVDYKFGTGTFDPERTLFPSAGEKIGTLSFISLIVNFVNGIDPYIQESYFSCGVVNTLAAAFFALSASQTIFNIFIRTWKFKSSISYADIFCDVFGKIPGFIIRVLVMFGASAKIGMATTNIQNSIQLLLNHFNVNKLLSNVYLCSYILVAPIVVLQAAIKTTAGLRYNSYVGNISLFVSIIYFTVYMFKVNKDGFDPMRKTKIITSDISTTLSCLFNMVSIFLNQPYVGTYAPFYCKRKQKDIQNVVLYSNLVTVIVNLLFGYISWFCFYGATNNFVNVLYIPLDNIFSIICVLSFIVRKITVISQFAYFLSFELNSFFLDEPDTIGRVMGALAIMAFFIGVCSLPKVFKFAMGIFRLSVVASFTLVPVILFLRMYGWRSKYGFISLMMLGMVVIVAIGVLYGKFAK